MKLLRFFLMIILLTLVAIGDAVLFIFRSIFFLFQSILKAIATGIQKVLWIIGYIPRKIFYIISHISHLKKMLPSPHVSIKLPKQQKYRAAPLMTKRQKVKPVLFFFPLTFFRKLKYFIAGSIFSFLFIFAPLLFLLFIQDLPSPKTLVLGQIPQTTKIYDRNHTLLYQLYTDQDRTIIPLQDVPKQLQQATIAIEDKDFYNHPGFDITAIIRSVVANFSGKELQGGSTITQQLIKSALLSPETSVTRKFKELVLAFWAERIYSKDQILAMYFNQVPYGGTAWGIEAAAQTYFGKNTKELDLAESAFLAGIPQAPSIYSPYSGAPNRWKKRQLDVLKRMVNLRYITQDQATQAANEQLSFRRLQLPLHAPHFVMYVRDLLIKKYGLPYVERGGLNVVTSLDLPVQEKAQSIVRNEVASNAALNLTNGAAMVTNPQNGDVIAMVGSRDFTYPGFGNVNVATSPRQPGSSIKVVTYAAAMQKGLTAASILDDSPVVYKNQWSTYAPVNYDGKFHGRVPLRIALANSFNIPAVKTLNQIGLTAMIDMAKQMGITTWTEPDRYGLSLTLGGAEVTMRDMTEVYGVLANSGTHVPVYPILKITDGKGNVLEEKTEIEEHPVLDPGIAFILSDILADNPSRAAAFGPNSTLNIKDHTVSVKTGTTDNKKDNWTFGYTKDRLVGVWVGNNNGSVMSQTLASGITGAAPIWNKIMTMLLEGKPDEKPAIPANVITKPCLGRIEYFVKGTENSVNCAYMPPTASPTPKPH